jgi:ABC-type multidrug transport system ATPase subunit
MRIELRELVVMRGATRAVDGVSLDIEPARWTGIVGANGSGKTSLLRALAGRLDIQCGTILADEADRTRDRAWRAANIGFAPDIAALPQSLSGAEMFAIVAPDWDAASRGGRMEELRAALDFDRLAAQRIGTLSSGMKQRLAIFLAFLNRPAAVVLDEPFTWLDPVCAYDTKQALAGLVAEEGLTLVTALHEMATLTGSCHSGILMTDGRVGRALDAADLEAGRRDYAAFEAEMIRSLREGGPGARVPPSAAVVTTAGGA